MKKPTLPKKYEVKINRFPETELVFHKDGDSFYYNPDEELMEQFAEDINQLTDYIEYLEKRILKLEKGD